MERCFWEDERLTKLNKYLFYTKRFLTMKKYTFASIAFEALQSLNKPSSVKNIWQEIISLGLDKKIDSKGLTPFDTLSSMLSTNVNKPNAIFTKNKDRPALYSIKSTENVNVSNELKNRNIKERDLHKYLVSFAFKSLNTYCKTIFHEKSNKKSFNEWIHPDLVGFSFPFSYSQEVLNFTNNGFDLIKFYSFEVKRELNIGNLRASFFQAVSNSSWAHEGYLVATNIEENAEFRLELERLVKSFGIGIIELRLDDMNKTNVLFQAKVKEKIDWNAVEKLVKENPDFKSFMNDVRIDAYNSKLHEQNYDIVENFDIKK